MEQLYRETVKREMERLTERIEQPLRRLEQVNPLHSPDAMYAAVAELSRRQEAACGELRNALQALFYSYEARGLSPRYVPLMEVPDFDISLTDGMMRIFMDALMPHPTKGSVFYLHGKLDAALARYVADNRIPRPFFRERCAVVFLHHYDLEKNRKRQLRDYDNLERRCILNVLTRHVLVDDSPEQLVSMDLMTADQRDYTEICVMPMERFGRYILSSGLLGKPTG